MPFVAVAGACQVNVKGFLFGQEYENVWGCESSTSPDITELADIAATFQTGYSSILNPLSSDLIINEIEVRYLGAETGPIYQLFISPSMDGANNTASAPGNIALCVRLSSALSGRRYRGRKYIGGIPVEALSGNTVDGTFASNVAAGCEALRTALATNGTPLAIISKTYGLVSPVVSCGVFDLNVDSQRRRLTGRGR